VRRLNGLDSARNQEAIIRFMVMIRDSDGIFKAVNGEIQQYPTDLNGECTKEKDQENNFVEIKGYHHELPARPPQLLLRMVAAPIAACLSTAAALHTAISPPVQRAAPSGNGIILP